MINERMTVTNVNDYLINCIGIPDTEVEAMPAYVKRELVLDDLDLFNEYLDSII